MAEGEGHQPLGSIKLKLPKESEVYHPGRTLRSAPTQPRRGFLGKIGKIIGIATGSLGAAWGGSELLKTAIDKDQKVQDAQFEAHQKQVQSQTNIEQLPQTKK